ncbi:hypothetical protein JX266_009220 [Neoarthrinium moseri]|nr:hypothetical protein JX266_009220 [Neoarthrinium moseri]
MRDEDEPREAVLSSVFVAAAKALEITGALPLTATGITEGAARESRDQHFFAYEAMLMLGGDGGQKTRIGCETQICLRVEPHLLAGGDGDMEGGDVNSPRTRIRTWACGAMGNTDEQLEEAAGSNAGDGG